jgi:peroxiredoxin Q/BCP
VSGDSVEALQRFRAKYKLNFPLAGDPTHKTLEAYGVWQEKNLYGRKSMGIVRTTYIIDGDGKIARVFPKVRVEGHIQEVLAALKR